MLIVELRSRSFSGNSTGSSQLSCSLDINNIPTLSQIVGQPSLSPQANSFVVQTPQGMISIYANMANVFFSIKQNLLTFHKSYVFDYYITACCNWLDSLTRNCSTLVNQYFQFIPIDSQAFWPMVPDMLEVEIFSTVSKQLHTIIQTVCSYFPSSNCLELGWSPRYSPRSLFNHLFLHECVRHLHLRCLHIQVLPESI